jgi:hypothetical protein
MLTDTALKSLNPKHASCKVPESRQSDVVQTTGLNPAITSRIFSAISPSTNSEISIE